MDSGVVVEDALADGELGTTSSEAELSATIARLLDEPKPDSGALAVAVRARFGRETFAANTRAAFNRLMEQQQSIGAV